MRVVLIGIVHTPGVILFIVDPNMKYLFINFKEWIELRFLGRFFVLGYHETELIIISARKSRFRAIINENILSKYCIILALCPTVCCCRRNIRNTFSFCSFYIDIFGYIGIWIGSNSLPFPPYSIPNPTEILISCLKWDHSIASQFQSRCCSFVTR